MTKIGETETVAELRVELGRERAKVRAVQDIGAALGSTLNLDELLSLILDRVSNLLSAERSTLYLLDDNTGELWSKIAQEAGAAEIRLKVGEGVAGWIAEHGQVLNIGDAYDDHRFDPAWDLRSGYRTQTILGVPMKNQHGRIIGVIQCLNKTAGPFNQEDEALLLALAGQAAVTIENSRLFLAMVKKNFDLLETQGQLERKVRELDLLFDITNHSARATDLTNLLRGTLERTREAMAARAVTVYLSDPGSESLKLASVVGVEKSPGAPVSLAPLEGICGWVAAEGEPALLNDPGADERYSGVIAEQIGFEPVAILSVPLSVDDSRGVLTVIDKAIPGKSGFDQDDLKLATVIAGHLQHLISLARAQEAREREQRLSSIGQTLSSVLHDMKSPMTVISGYLQLLRDEEDPEARDKYSRTGLRQVELINEMTKETLAFARGDTQLWVRKVYLHRFFQELAEQVQRDLAESSVEVELSLLDRSVAHFDGPKIQRAVHNLARNAAEAVAGKPGRFLIEVDRRGDDGALVLRCIDDGPGVPEAIRGRLFESFTTHGKKGGTGLGLAMVRKVAVDHGGSIACESEPGRTVFTMVLPQPPEEGGRAVEPQPA